ncbi:hypothetical protein JEU11_05010 [Paraglaciecola chathamensis]|uniref:Uncharacterized protein n=1 Tax=Paraglaciecola chathamensis TaxID=368405 RepID=A0ABS0WBJ3_9ALTE|nr:hypothetical protein [Paraglaciecola chathamensis]MBJ2135808.1 hypothetical protein [Paraglaciecola chathamensis]
MSIDKFGSLEELKQFFSNGGNPRFDAEFSPQTLMIVEALGAKGAHLNKWWVRTPMDWECPSCKRKKTQIAKLDSRGYASCQLHEHHDHMKDIVRRLFEEISSSREQVVATELAERFAVRTSFAISAYDNTVICADCNKADGLAKLKIKTHQDFSFSPAEIGRFVKPRNNQEHEIDAEIATNIWHENIGVFNKRMKLAEYVAGLAASDAHWYQPSISTSKEVERSANYRFNLRGLKSLHEEPEKLLYNSMPFKGNHSSWRLNPKPMTKGRPTEGQVAHLSNTRGRSWTKYDDSWKCPCCERSKFECLKPSKNNPWVFEVKSILAHKKESDSLADDIKVCNECFNAANHLGREAIEEVKEEDPPINVYFPHSLIAFEELKSVIVARPHSFHLINNERAENVVKTAIDRIVDENYHYSPKNRTDIMEMQLMCP